VGRGENAIDEHLGDNLMLVTLANVAGVSASYFGHLFRNSFVVAPHQYLLKRRLDRARTLLRNNRQSIAEIASVTGFSDQGHLTRHFKRQFGVTPQECRRDDGRFVSGSSEHVLTNTR
jgi:AraC family transcriptional regulator